MQTCTTRLNFNVLAALWTRATILSLVLILCCGPQLANAATQAGNSPSPRLIAFQDVEAAASPVDQPTPIPTPEIEPTLEPEPTSTEPVPTETVPAEATPTEVEPTLEPTSTEVPSPTPTETAEPTAEPILPFDPSLTCELSDLSSQAVAGSATRGWLGCTVTWETRDATELRIKAMTEAADWTVVVVDGGLGQDLNGEISGDDWIALSDDDNDDSGFLSAEFVVGTQLGCLAASSADIGFELNLTSGSPASDDSDLTEEAASRSVTIDGDGNSVPKISIASVSFDPIKNSLTMPDYVRGSLVVNVRDASAACGWSTEITFTDFTSGNVVIPAANMNAIKVSGIDGVSIGSSEGGVISILASPSESMAEDATITITTELEIDGFLPEGNYQATVTVVANLFP